MSGSDYPKRKLSTDNYHTDTWILKMFQGWFDPCPFNPKYNPILFQNGLDIEWPNRTFVNPPYSNPLPWVEKAIKSNEKGSTVAMLLKHDSSTKWYALLHQHGARFLLIHGRLKHQTSRSAAFPSVIAILEGS